MSRLWRKKNGKWKTGDPGDPGVPSGSGGQGGPSGPSSPGNPDGPYDLGGQNCWGDQGGQMSRPCI